MAIDLEKYRKATTTAPVDLSKYKKAPTAIPQPVQQEAPKLWDTSGFKAGFTGGAKSLGKTALGAAELVTGLGRGIGNIFGLGIEKSDLFDKGREALAPSSDQERTAMLGADLSQFFLPAGQVNKATKALPWAKRTLTRALPDVGIEAAQSGDAGMTATTGAASLTANALMPGPLSSIRSKLLGGAIPGYVGDVGTGLQGLRGEDRTGAKALIPGVGTALGTAFGSVSAAPAVKDRIKAGQFTNPDKVVSKRVSALNTITGNKGPVYKTVEAAKRRGVPDPLGDIAKTDLLVGAVDSNGTINAKNAIDNFNEVLNPYEAKVGQAIAEEGKTVNIEVLLQKLRATINSSKLAGKNKNKAMSEAAAELDGLMLVADEAGNIPLSEVHKAKVSSGGTINYLDPEKAATSKIVVQGLKEFVEENTTSINVKQYNSELSKLYSVRDILEQLNNRKVEGGRLGKHFSAVIGTMVGGSAGGPLGAVAGAEIGSKLKGAQMSQSFGKGGKPLEVSTKLTDALKPTATGKAAVSDLVIPKSKTIIPIKKDTSKSVPKKSTVKKPVIPKTDKLQAEIDVLEDVIDQNPAKALMKYRARGDNSLAEINSKNQGTGAKSAKLDDIVTELGYKDLDDAQKAVDDYIVQRDKLSAMKSEKNNIKYGEAFAGIGLGFEKDENGNITFSPEKAAMGMAGVFGVTQARAKVMTHPELIAKMRTSVTNKTKLEMADFVRMIKGGHVKTNNKGVLEFADKEAKTAFEDGLRLLNEKPLLKDTKYQSSTLSKIASLFDEMLDNPLKSKLKAGEILVRQKKTGKVGAILEKNFNTGTYERV